MTDRPRLLFVDDEPSIRLTLSAILEQRGFKVTAASTVAEALALITAERYDALISDLNIGSAGDGFTVVSAMRRVQPEAVTLILTGYPAFESALRAIREQVDDFLTKPADTDELVNSIKEKLNTRRGPSRTLTTKRLSELIEENKAKIIEDWLREIERVPEVTAITLSRGERLNHLPGVLDELIRGNVPDRDLTGEARGSAATHGAKRREQGYSVPMLLEEARILQFVISDHTRRNLLRTDISHLVSDMIDISDRIHLLFQESVRAYLRPEKKQGIA